MCRHLTGTDIPLLSDHLAVWRDVLEADTPVKY